MSCISWHTRGVSDDVATSTFDLSADSSPTTDADLLSSPDAYDSRSLRTSVAGYNTNSAESENLTTATTTVGVGNIVHN